MTTIGTLGARWRGSVRPWGAVEAGGVVVDWWVAADDRWHTPRTEPSLRQRLAGGTPVVETIIRVPGGDAIHRAYGVPDAGGLVVIEVENASALPIAVAFDRSDLLFARPPSSQLPGGIELPPGSVVLPVGHRATVRVAVAAGGRRSGSGQLPPGLAGADQVARGWEVQASRGLRIEGLDDELSVALTEARCRLLLDGPSRLDDDVVGLLLGVAELVRLGDDPGPWVEEVAEAAVRAARSARGSDQVVWDVEAALDAAVEVLARAGESVGASDAARLASTVPAAAAVPGEVPDDPARRVAWVLRRLVRPTSRGADLLPEPLPSWLGRDLAVYGAWVGGGELSFAVRWHGERPALLWEAAPGLTLRTPAIDPAWSTTAPLGDALLASPNTTV